MSQPSGPSRPSYQRTFPGLIAAMAVVVLVVVGWTGFRELTSDKEPTPVETVDWKPAVVAARADHQLLVMAPTELPKGWRATSVTYEGDVTPSWHLGMLTDHGKYVGIEEQRVDLAALVSQYVDKAAAQGKDVRLNDVAWQSWTDSGGDYALGRTVRRAGQPAESYLVVGSAPPEQVRALAGSLRGAAPGRG